MYLFVVFSEGGIVECWGAVADAASVVDAVLLILPSQIQIYFLGQNTNIFSRTKLKYTSKDRTQRTKYKYTSKEKYKYASKDKMINMLPRTKHKYTSKDKTQIYIQGQKRNIFILEVWGPSGPQLLVCGPSGLFDFVLLALRALRPCDPCNDAVIG